MSTWREIIIAPTQVDLPGVHRWQKYEGGDLRIQIVRAEVQVRVYSKSVISSTDSTNLQLTWNHNTAGSRSHFFIRVNLFSSRYGSQKELILSHICSAGHSS